MIQDFPEEKYKLMKALNDRLVSKQAEFLGYFSQIPAYAHHEGNKWATVTTDGNEREQEYKELGWEFSLSVDEVPDMSLADVLSLIDKVALDAARQMHDEIMGEISRSVEDSGRGIDAKCQPLNQELFLQGLESIDLSFNRDGTLIPPAMIMHPKLWEARQEDIKSWENDPDFVARQELLIQKKREEWRARETRRKLVD